MKTTWTTEDVFMDGIVKEKVIMSKTLYEEFFDYIFDDIDEDFGDYSQYICEYCNFVEKEDYLKYCHDEIDEDELIKKHKMTVKQSGWLWTSEPELAFKNSTFYAIKNGTYLGNYWGATGYIYSLHNPEEWEAFIAQQPEPTDSIDVFAEDNIGWLK